MKRQLYLIAYDIRQPKRLRQVHKTLKQFATGGQKSAYEFYLGKAEKVNLVQQVKANMDTTVDALLVMQSHNRNSVFTLGIACQPSDELYTYIG